MSNQFLDFSPTFFKKIPMKSRKILQKVNLKLFHFQFSVSFSEKF